jgi:acyl carrier protein phosphodiesterase
MNILAHAYLAGNNDSLQIGGFIADYVKGKVFDKYPEDIKKGIVLHRRIDEYTDAHPKVKSLIELLKPTFGRYAGIITDVFFDHFLNRHWHIYSDISLQHYVKRFYVLILKHFFIIPERQRLLLPFLIFNNWLESYGSFSGLEKRLAGMSKRINFDCHLEKAVNHLEQNYDIFDKTFPDIFADLIHFSSIQSNRL